MPPACTLHRQGFRVRETPIKSGYESLGSFENHGLFRLASYAMLRLQGITAFGLCFGEASGLRGSHGPKPSLNPKPTTLNPHLACGEEG